MKRLLILMLFGVLFVPMVGSAKADEVLYCQSELATGFYKENGTWKSGDFKPKRFTVKVVKILNESKFFIRMTIFYATIHLVNYRISLFTVMNLFFYDKLSKGFLLSYVNTSTYLHTDTPALFAGTCQKF